MDIRPVKHLISIPGPTAVGKTGLSIRLAKAFGAPIVSADSVQIYKGLDIGSGKVTADEMEGVTHYMLDVLEPGTEFNAGEYGRRVDDLLVELFQRHDVVLLVGGSGFYFQAVWEGFDKIPEIDPRVREGLMEELETKGLPVLVEELARVDPVTWDKVDRANPARVVRALEVFRGSGTPISVFRKQAMNKQKGYADIKVGLDLPRPELYARIEARVDVMLAAGWVEELRGLIAQYGPDATGLGSLGYREIGRFLAGEWDEAEMVEMIKRNTRRFAKRQLTWFRRYADIHWFHPAAEAEIRAFLQRQMLPG